MPLRSSLPSRPWARSALSLSLSAVFGLGLTACAVTAVAPPAPVAAPAAFKEDGLWQRAQGQAATVPDAWWTLFQDPVLNDLQARLLQGNESLRQLAAQVASARAVLDASRSALFPTLTATGSGTRSLSSSSGNSGPGAASANISNNYSAGLSSSWEIDLWGRLSQASQGASSTLQASVNDLSAGRLSAQALLAQSYFSLRASEAQQALLQRSEAAYAKSLALTEARYSGGVAQRSEVLQAQTQLKTVQAQLADVRAQRAQYEHAIAVLLGQAPSSFSLARTAQLPSPPEAPRFLPSQLLQRRPDIAAAQQRVVAAYAQIGVVDAAFFPTLTLSASLGQKSSVWSQLAEAPSRFWSIGPSVAAAILDGGQRKLASAQARSSADQASSTYRQLVLTALQEVEDNLVLADQLQEEARLQDEARQAAAQQLDIVMEQYRAGTVSYLNVVVAQNTLLSSEQTLLSVRNRQLAALNLLLKNIAGRWEAA